MAQTFLEATLNAAIVESIEFVLRGCAMAQATPSQIIDAIGDAVIVTDIEDRITYWGLGAEQLYGHAADEVLGKNLIQVVQPEDPAAAAPDWIQNLSDRGCWRGRTLRRRRDGCQIRADSSVFLIRDDDGNPVGTVSIERGAAGQIVAEDSNVEIERSVESRTKDLSDRERLYRSIVQTAGNVILVLDESGRILEWSQGAEQLYGYRRADAIGKDYMVLCLPEGVRGVVREDMRKVFAGQRTMSYENATIDRKGGRHDVVWNVNRLVDERDEPYAVAAVGHDITARKKGEKALRESERRFRELANALPFFIWMTGLDKGATYVNQSYLDFTGRTLKDMRGFNWTSVVHPDDRERYLTVYETAFAKREPFDTELRIRRRDGTYAWMISRGRPRIQEDGTLVGYVGAAIDITERKELEERWRALQADLAHFDRVSRLGEMANALSHELRQPLGSLVNYSEQCAAKLNAQQVDAKEIAKILGKIAEQAKRASEISQRMQSFGAKPSQQQDTTNVSEIVREVAGLLEAHVHWIHARLRLCLAEELPLVSADRIHIQQVIVNLVTNALDAMQSVPQKQREIRIETSRQADGVRIEVADRGTGIPPDDVEDIFEPYFTTKSDGMGMGLAICRTIVESHGGRISAMNREGGGAVFRLSLPTTGRRIAAAASAEN